MTYTRITKKNYILVQGDTRHGYVEVPEAQAFAVIPVEGYVIECFLVSDGYEISVLDSLTGTVITKGGSRLDILRRVTKDILDTGVIAFLEFQKKTLQTYGCTPAFSKGSDG